MQLYITLVILLSCFAITLVCVFLVIARSRKSAKTTNTAKTDLQLETNTPVERSYQNSSITKRNISPQAQSGKPLVVNYGADSLSSDTSLKDSNSLFVPAAASNSPVKSAHDFRAHEDKHRNSPPPKENTPLLSSSNATRPELEATVVGFGTMPTVGLWDKDTSGKHLVRFIVLLMFLMFSSLVVS